MKPLTQYGLMAEKHWREFRPRMVAELEATNQHHTMLLTVEEQTEMELDQLRRQLIQQGLPPQQAHDQAWEMVREKYIFLPPESMATMITPKPTPD
jgi:formate dehydrogenase maturation protein FdhE